MVQFELKVVQFELKVDQFELEVDKFELNKFIGLLESTAFTVS